MWMDRREPTSSRSGFALEATMMLLILLTVLISAGLAATMMVQRSSGVDYRGARATYAAESGADHVMSQLEGDIQDGSISDAELAALTPPVIGGFNLPSAVPASARRSPRPSRAGRIPASSDSTSSSTSRCTL